MTDSHGRTIDYMRISITDRCNLRCQYCMPHGICCVPMEEVLTYEEIRQVVSVGADLGIRHLKITGGEPLVRKGCCDLIRMLKQIPGIKSVTITTNGVLLGEYLDGLMAAGIDGINISLDTTDRKQYETITGFDLLDQVMENIQKASALPVPVKINAVSLDLGRKWRDLVELARIYPVDVRFIEMMPIGYGKEFPVLGHDDLLRRITAEYPKIRRDFRVHGYGPAVYYRIPGLQGSVGFISAIHGKFCGLCNRVRLTARGYLKTCLCYEDGTDLRDILRGGGSPKERQKRLCQAMARAIEEKPDAHCFEKPERMTELHNMNEIGG